MSFIDPVLLMTRSDAQASIDSINSNINALQISENGKADKTTVPPAYMPRSEAESSIATINLSLSNKADVSTVSALSSTVSSKADGSTVTAISGRVTTLETKYTTGQAASIAPVSGGTSTSVVDVAGISVAVGSSFTNMGVTVAEIKTKLNALIAACKTWGWMATA